MAKKKTSKFYFKNEKELMRSLGLNPTPGSGNKIIKEDGQNDKIIAQLKSTEGSQITIKLVDLNTLLYNATITHKLPIFINQFVNGPILISCKMEDFIDVAKYIQTGEYKSRFEEIVEVENVNEAPKQKIKSTRRKQIKNKIAKEKESRIEQIKKERKERK